MSSTGTLKNGDIQFDTAEPMHAINDVDSAHHETPDENMMVLAVKVVVALIFSQLQKLPISSRIVHQFLIIHCVLSMLGLGQYLMLCSAHIVEHYQYWRLVTYNLADSNLFMALIGSITLSDIIKRMEYYFGSLWTLYLLAINWLLLSVLTLIAQHIAMQYSLLSECQCIGLYPMIFSLWMIETALSSPSQIELIVGFIYLPQIYHPFIYCFLYNALIRFDVASIIGISYSSLLLYVIPWIFHLSRHKIQKLQKLKCMKCVMNDGLFISIESIDYDCFVSTGKFISANSDKNTHLDAALILTNHNCKEEEYEDDDDTETNATDAPHHSDQEELPFINVRVNRRRS